jgi:hypothetical protein
MDGSVDSDGVLVLAVRYDALRTEGAYVDANAPGGTLPPLGLWMASLLCLRDARA